MTKSIADLFVVYKGLVPEIKEYEEEIPLHIKRPRYDNYIDLLSMLGSRKINTSEEQEIEEPEETINSVKDTSKKLDSKNQFMTAFNFFLDKGFTPVQVSGILGNLIAESNLNTSAINKEEKESGLSGFGRGIAQWSNSRVKDFEKLYGKKIEESSLDEQLDFAWHEMQQRPAFLDAITSSTTLQEASDAVYRGFENGSNQALASKVRMISTYEKAWSALKGYRKYDFDKELQRRTDKALEAYDLYMNYGTSGS